jgi:dihydrofolate reductase
MRKFIVLSFITLDGVMQAPGGPDEDMSGDFQFGGWVAPFGDDESGQFMQKLLAPADLLLGRKTFDIWENYWPQHASNWPGINDVTKYVLSKTRNESQWSNCKFLHSAEEVKQLKTNSGSDIKIWGSSELVQLLLKLDLIDEFWLMTHPVILGRGKRLFAEDAVAGNYRMKESLVTSKGVIIANYQRNGEVKTGNAGEG